jgi:hypothetical protein
VQRRHFIVAIARGVRNNSGSLAILLAIPRASSRVSNFAAESPPRLILEIDIRERLSVVARTTKQASNSSTD